MREIASHINVVVATSLMLIAIFIAFIKPINKYLSEYSKQINYFLPFLSIILFVISVLAAWYSGNSNHVAISGLLPWNDANGYYQCAHTLLDKWEMSLFCQRRPIYSFYLATLLGITGRDLQLVLLLQSILLGSVAYLFAKQLAHRLGGPAALIAFALMFIFASDYSMTTLTANAGLLYGMFGFVFIWAGTNKQNTVLISFGVFMLTLGLNARSGAFFVLPLIIIWSIYFLNLKSKQRIIIPAAIVLAIISGFIFNAGLMKSINADQSQTHANFSYSFYGLTAGGKSWTHVYQSEPEIFSEGGSENVVARKIYIASLHNIITQPQLFIKGYLKGLSHHLEKLLHFVRKTPHELSFLRLTFVFFWFVGFISCLKGIRKDSHLALSASMIIGVILSAPFIKDGGSRVYAATIVIDATLVAIGFFSLQQMIQNRRMALVRLLDVTEGKLQSHIIIISISMLFLIFPAPLLIRQAVALAPINVDDCDNDLKSFVYRNGLESTTLRITSNINEYTLFPLGVPVEDYRMRLQKKGVHFESELANLPTNTTLVWAYQRAKNNFGKRSMICP